MSEKAELKRMGAKATKNSGRGDYQKGDGLLDIFTVDVKEYSKGYRVDKTTWAKICGDAYRNNRSEPLLALVIGEDVKTRVAVVSMDVIEDYIRLRKAEEDATI